MLMRGIGCVVVGGGVGGVHVSTGSLLRFSCDTQGGRNPVWLGPNSCTIPLPYQLPRGTPASLLVSAFDFEGGAGVKDKDDFIGKGVLDVAAFLSGEAVRGTGGGGVEMPVQLCDLKGKPSAGNVVLRVRVTLSCAPSTPGVGAGAGRAGAGRAGAGAARAGAGQAGVGVSAGAGAGRGSSSAGSVSATPVPPPEVPHTRRNRHVVSWRRPKS